MDFSDSCLRQQELYSTIDSNKDFWYPWFLSNPMRITVANAAPGEEMLTFVNIHHQRFWKGIKSGETRTTFSHVTAELEEQGWIRYMDMLLRIVGSP